MVNVTVHKVLIFLDIEEHWTQEHTPQLKKVQVINRHGVESLKVVTKIFPGDLRKAVETLQQIHSDMELQKTVKYRLSQREGKTCQG